MRFNVVLVTIQRLLPRHSRVIIPKSEVESFLDSQQWYGFNLCPSSVSLCFLPGRFHLPHRFEHGTLMCRFPKLLPPFSPNTSPCVVSILSNQHSSSQDTFRLGPCPPSSRPRSGFPQSLARKDLRFATSLVCETAESHTASSQSETGTVQPGDLYAQLAFSAVLTVVQQVLTRYAFAHLSWYLVFERCLVSVQALIRTSDAFWSVVHQQTLNPHSHSLRASASVRT